MSSVFNNIIITIITKNIFMHSVHIPFKVCDSHMSNDFFKEMPILNICNHNFIAIASTAYMV